MPSERWKTSLQQDSVNADQGFQISVYRSVSNSDNPVIPTKRSAWRDLRTIKSVQSCHYWRAFNTAVRRSIDFARDDRCGS